MEWYWVVLMLAALAALVCVLYILRKKGVISHDAMSLVKALVAFVKGLVEKYLSKNQSTAAQVATYMIRLVDASILMAEHLWYQGEIDYDHRKDKAKELLLDLLKDAGVTVPEDADDLLDTLMDAAREATGHESYDEYAVALVAECGLEEEA